MLAFKKGVKSNLPVVTMLQVATEIYDTFGFDCVVTSLADGKHKPTSFHYKDLAVDLRTRHVDSRATLEQIIQSISNVLGPDYDVVLEGDHLHVEFDPDVANPTRTSRTQAR